MKSGFSNSHFHFACSTLESEILLHFHGGGNFFLHCMETARASTLKSPGFKKTSPQHSKRILSSTDHISPC